MSRGALLAAFLLLSGCGAQPDEGRNMSMDEVAKELANVRIEPGLWESTRELVSIDAPNLPRELQQRAMARGASTVRHCITPEQAGNPQANFLATQEGRSCTYRDFTMRDGRMRGTMTCTGGESEGPTTGEMEGSYRPDSYDMRMRMAVSGPGGVTMNVETRAQGRRIGDCPEEGVESK